MDYPIVVIAEKPKAAARIAQALGLNTRLRLYSVPYWKGLFNGEEVILLSAAGHLFSLKPIGRGYPIFNYEWVPRYEIDRKASHTEKFLAVIEKLGKGAKEYINACDYDIEGSVIGYQIIKHLKGLERARRVKFSSLTLEELRKAFANVNKLDKFMVEAGLCRHELDWIWGINVSRALMNIYRTLTGGRLILSAGRVQSPTLMEVIRRQVERSTFVPEVIVDIAVHVSIGNVRYKLENRFQPPQTLSKAREIVNKLRSGGEITITKALKEIKKISPPPPFNLPDLQVEASRVIGISPSETLRIAESLYLDSLISYPRTNSQKLPRNLRHKDILLKLSRLKTYTAYCNELIRKERLSPREGGKKDPAHPAIYPTGYLPRRKLSRKQWLVYDLIVRRYLASLSKPVVVEKTVYFMESAGLVFALRGQVILDSGWLKIYKYFKISEKLLPNLSEGSRMRFDSARIIKKYSKPPPKYTRSSLLKWMESVNIGTEATRANIIDVLLKRRYLKSERGLEVTELGWKVANVLKKFFDEIITVELTRAFERKLNEVGLSREPREKVVDEVISFLEPRLNRVKNLLKEIKAEDKPSHLKSLFRAPQTKCDICGREAYVTRKSLHLCELHGVAYDKVLKGFDYWNARLGIDFRTYLKNIVKLKNTGKYAKEVADYLWRNNLKV